MVASSRVASRAMILMLLVLAVAAVGCGKNSSNANSTNAGPTSDRVPVPDKTRFSSEPPPVQTLGGPDTGFRVSKPTAIIVRSLSEQTALYKKHFSHGVKREQPPGTDFKTRQLVGAFVPKQKAGTELVILGVSQDNQTKKVRVEVLLMAPGAGCSSKGIPRYPFHVVETRKMQGDPYIALKHQRQSPCK